MSTSPKPSKLLLQAIATILTDPAAHGHPDLPPIGRFRERFDAHYNGIDHISGDWFALYDSGRNPLPSETAGRLVCLPIPAACQPNGRVPELGEVVTDLIEDHFDVHHPEWTADEGSYGCVTLHFHPRPHFTGTLRHRFIATRRVRI